MKNFIKLYKEVDLKLLEAIKSDGNIDEIIDERGKIIKSINSIQESKSELKELFFKEGLDELDKEIERQLIQEKAKVKEEINRIQAAKNAQNGYAMATRRANLFSKKV